MRKLQSIILLVVLTILTSSIAEAQRFTKRKQYWSIGGSINANNYMGDIVNNLNPASIDFKFTKPNIGVEAMKRMTPRASVRVQAFWGRVKGNDNNHVRNGHDQRNQRFVNDIREISVMGVFDLYENRGTFLKRPDYTPYAILGLAGFYHNPWMQQAADADGKTTGAKTSGTTFNSFDKNKTSVIQAALIYGVGFRYKLARQLDIALEMGWRLTTTDKLDGVYGDYHKTSDYGGNQNLAYADQPEEYKLHNATGSVYGDERIDGDGVIKGKSGFGKQDAYLVTGFHLTYILTGHVVCPKFR